MKIKKFIAWTVSVALFVLVLGFLVGRLGTEIPAIIITWLIILLWTFIYFTIWFFGCVVGKQIERIERKKSLDEIKAKSKEQEIKK